MVKNLPAKARDIESRVQSLGQEDLLEEEMAAHSSILAWKNPMNRGAWRATIQATNTFTLIMCVR